MVYFAAIVARNKFPIAYSGLNPFQGSFTLCQVSVGFTYGYYCYALPGFWEMYVDTYLNLLVPK